MSSNARAGMPTTLRWATWLAFVYAAVIIANATVGQVLTDWVDANDYFRGLIRAAGYSLIGVGLLRRVKVAWWVGIGVSAWLLLLALFAIGTLVAVWSPEAKAVLPPMFFPVAIVTTTLLAAILVLLLHPRTRAAIHGTAA